MRECPEGVSGGVALSRYGAADGSRCGSENEDNMFTIYNGNIFIGLSFVFSANSSAGLLGLSKHVLNPF